MFKTRGPARWNFIVWIAWSLGAHAMGFALVTWILGRSPSAQYAQLAPNSGSMLLQSVQKLAPKQQSDNPFARSINRQVASQTPPSHGGGGDGLPVAADELLVTEMPALQSEVRTPYPEEARSRGIQGAVKMDLLIDENGVVRDVRLLEGPGYGLNEAALAAVRAFRFSPAKVVEKSVAVRVRYSYRFILDR